MGTSRVAKTTKHTKQPAHNPEHIIRNLIGDNKATNYNINTDTPTQKNPPLLLIIWEDAITIGDQWTNTRDTTDTKPEPTISIGYLWNKTDTHHTLVSTLNTQHIGGGILIPNGCITKTTTLNPPHTTT